MAILFTLMVATVAATVTTAFAIPARIETTPGTFSFDQVRNLNFRPHGAIALERVYRKYGATIPDGLKAAVARYHNSKRDMGSAATTPEKYDSEYLTPVEIGTPAQTLNLDFDTGSSDLWVFSSETPSSSIKGQTVYKPSASNSSEKITGASWKISYGDGSSSSGDVYTDIVTVGGLVVKGQAVESAKKVSSEFTQDSSNDGLLGLAFSSLNTVTPTPQKTFFDNAMDILDAPIFTVDLKSGKPGKYNFGYIDNQAYTGEITYTKVDNSQGFWMFDSVDGLTGTKITGIADTGTTLLLLPTAVIEAYYKQIDGSENSSQQGGWIFPCSSTVPDFAFSIENRNFTIPGSYMNFAPNDDSGSTCFGGLQDDSGVGFAIFGDVALKTALVIFDGGNTQLGWANKNL